MHTITLFAALSIAFILSGAEGMALGQLASVMASGLVFFGTLSLGRHEHTKSGDSGLGGELSKEG
ncbi:MAG: hypothetical protein GX614_02810 [Sandaracinaceae bacterium]|nr:hypothetical protein [Sandaracinaceae bacterium]